MFEDKALTFLVRITEKGPRMKSDDSNIVESRGRRIFLERAMHPDEVFIGRDQSRRIGSVGLSSVCRTR